MGWSKKELREELERVQVEKSMYRNRVLTQESEYMALNNKISDINNRTKALNDDIARLKKENNDLSRKLYNSDTYGKDMHKSYMALKKKFDAMSNEMELMYLRAIGDATTVKEVHKILRRSLGFLEYDTAKTSCLEDFFVSIRRDPFARALSSLHNAAKTKIRRLHRDEVKLTLSLLEDGAAGKVPDTMYVGVMARLVEGIANTKIDGVKVLEAKNAGLNPEQVLDSILVQYGIDKDSVM